MLEKNVFTFSRHLEEINIKNTADAFKREFISKPNDAYELGKYNILKHLQKELNKCTGTNTSIDYSPTSARKKMKQENPIFTNLLSKIAKRQKEKKEETKNNNKKIKIKNSSPHIQHKYKYSTISNSNCSRNNSQVLINVNTNIINSTNSIEKLKLYKKIKYYNQIFSQKIIEMSRNIVPTSKKRNSSPACPRTGISRARACRKSPSRGAATWAKARCSTA